MSGDWQRQIDRLGSVPTRRTLRLELIGEQLLDLTDLDLLRLLEAVICQGDGSAALEASGTLARLDAEEAAWCSIFDRAGMAQHQLRALDGEEGRWPTLRSRLLWQAWEEARRRGEQHAARNMGELAAWAVHLRGPRQERGTGRQQSARGHLRLVCSQE